MYKLLILYLLFYHNLMIGVVLGSVKYLFISASVIGIILMLGNFPGNESFRIEIASPFYIC